MLTYIARRLLLMIVTIFGITLVTLGIMRMTPGDPAQTAIQQAESGGPQVHLSRDELEQIRARYGLDKPAFFNTQPLDRTVRFSKRLRDYEDTERVVKEIPRKLTLMGTASLKPAFELLQSGTSTQQTQILQSLEHLAQDLTTRPSGKLDRAAWQAWWAKHREALTFEKGNAATAAYLSRRDLTGAPALRAEVGTLANPALIAHLDDADLTVQALVCKALAEINRKPSRALAAGVDPTSAAAAPDLKLRRKQWRQFWREEESGFIDLTTGQRWLRLFTETHYATWISQLARWDLGDSTKFNKPVLEILPSRIQVTLQLALLSIFLSYLIAIPLGIYSASRSYSLGDRFTTLILFILYSLPSFWVGIMFIIISIE